jgi:hypothetical protein
MAGDQIQVSADPFGAGSEAIVAPPLRRTFNEVMRHVDLRSGLVVVVGSAGTGKTLLLQFLQEACAKRGLLVSRVFRGDLATAAASTKCDLLLIDEADCISDEVFQALVDRQAGNAKTIVLACAHNPDYDLPKDGAAFVALNPLTNEEARAYLHLACAKPDLFSTDALNLLVRASGGSPRMLRQMTSFAFFCAKRDARSQVATSDVQEAMASRMIALPNESDPEAETLSDDSSVPSIESPGRAAIGDAALRQGLGAKWKGVAALATRLRDQGLWLLVGPCIAVAGSIAIAAIGSRILHDHSLVIKSSSRAIASVQRGASDDGAFPQKESKQLAVATDIPAEASAAVASELGAPSLVVPKAPRVDMGGRQRYFGPTRKYNIIRKAVSRLAASQEVRNSKSMRSMKRGAPSLRRKQKVASKGMNRRTATLLQTRSVSVISVSRVRPKSSTRLSPQPFHRSTQSRSIIAIIGDRLRSWFEDPPLLAQNSPRQFRAIVPGVGTKRDESTNRSDDFAAASMPAALRIVATRCLK